MQPVFNKPSFGFRGAACLFSTTLVLTTLLLASCADVSVPGARDVHIPPARNAEERKEGVNERPDSVTYLPLGEDVLVPEAEGGVPLPATIVGPFELRSETLAGALQLVLDGTNIPVAFETQSALTETITVTNLKGPLDSVVTQMCGLANLYCSYQSGILVVKDTEIFTVTIPPIVANAEIATLLTNIAAAVGNITGAAPITDPSTRTIVYRASERTAEMAERYFQRLRTNTALIVFETYIWEVSLNVGNTTGIRWDMFDTIGKYEVGINLPGAANPLLGTPISIGLPTTNGPIDIATSDVVQFMSTYGAVKTISQPQVTVLSGSSARLRVADTQNYVASISRTTTDGGNTTVSTSTDSVDSGFTLEIASNWDNASVYSNINILLQEVRGIDTFDDNPDAVVQLPQTTERELQTQVRVRPGDSLLIAGLVRESDNFDKSGPGVTAPIIPISRTAQTQNSELVFLLRPRVIVFTSQKSAPRPGGVVPAIPLEKGQDVVAEPVVPLPVVVAQPPAAEVKALTPVPGEPAQVLPVPVEKPQTAIVAPVPEPVSQAPIPSPKQSAQTLVVPAPVAIAPAPLPSPLQVPVPPPVAFDPVPLAEEPVPVPAPASPPESSNSANADPSVIIDYNLLKQQ